MRRFNSKRISLVIILLVIIMAAIFINIINNPYITAENVKEDEGEFLYTPIIETYLGMSADDLHSNSGILIRLEDNKMFLDKNKDQITFPASLTKIMTTIVAIENLEDLDIEISVDGSIFSELFQANASLSGFQPDEEVRARDLLYGAMLPSGAESCITLANEIAGSEEAFVQMMNSRARELGMTKTNFMNTTGLHHDEHYSTVEDIAISLKYALQNETFREIFTSESYTTKATNLNPDGLTFKSTMFWKLDKQSIEDGKFLGGKTGYTGKAGLCLASLSKVYGEEYILITVGAEGDLRTEQFNIIDAITVYNNINKALIN